MRIVVGFLVVGAMVSVGGCSGGNGRTDGGSSGIDAFIVRNDSGSSATTDAFVATCATTGDENTAAACGDGCDNEGDGFADCNDYDCCDLVTCGPTTGCGIRANTDGGTCTSGDENTVAACSDGCSNDGDTYSDCNDRDCCGVVTCGASTYCGRDAGTTSTGTCDAGAGVVEESEEACTNGSDDDCDGFVDCEDYGCSVYGASDRTWCLENSSTLCTNGTDDDGDSYIDCNDRDCCNAVSMSSCGSTTYIGQGRCGG